MSRLTDEQIVPFRTDADKADTPEKREARIQGHIARIEALGLSGEAWNEAVRSNTSAVRRSGWNARKRLKREYNARRNAEIRAIQAVKQEAERPKPPVATLTEIRADIEAVCEALGVPVETVLDRKRWRSAVYTRRLVVKGLLDLGYTYADISRGMGRDTTWANKLMQRTPSEESEPMLNFTSCQPAA